MKTKCEVCNTEVPPEIIAKVREFFTELAADFQVPPELVDHIKILCPRCALFVALPPKGMAA